MEDMKKHLPEVDLEKLKVVLAIKERYLSGHLSLRDAQAELKQQVKSIRPYELALAEQELKTFEEDECRKEDIQQMMELFDGLLDTSRPELDPDHPIMCYYRENDEMRKWLKEVERLAPYPMIKNEWLGLYDELLKWRIHLSRKQNQLYSILERKGFDRPTTTMWLLDDFVRDEIRDASRLLEEDKDEAFIAMQKTIIADVLDLMQKEETVLYPTSLAMIQPREFEEMKAGDREIGFAWITVGEAKQEAKAPAAQADAAMGFAGELASLLGKYGFGGSASPEQLLDLATGQMTLEQVNLVYKHMPVDFSYVDEQEIVRFYTDTEHRVFPRSKNVIGRDVKNCHPRTSVHLVEEIIEKFRSGEQDSVDFWINKPGLFIYIYYVAVRDAEGRFRGVLEMMQDCTRIRSLEGSRTLLTWDKSNKEARKGQESSAYEAAPSPDSSNIPSVEEPKEPESSSVSGSALELVPEARLKTLLDAYPWLKHELPEINPAFKMLSSPLARIMIPKATLAMMSERSGMSLEELRSAIEQRIAAHRD